MTTVTYNIQINMSATSFKYWYEYLAQARNAYNYCAKYLSDNDIALNIHAVHEAVYNRLRENFTMLPSQACIKVYKEVIASLRTIKSNKHKNAEIPQRKSLAMRIDKRLYANLSVEGIALTGEVKNKRTFYPFVKYDKMEEMFSNYVTKDPLIFIREDRVFLSVPFEVPEIPAKDNTSVGVDLGMKRMFVTSEGKAFRDKRYLAKRRKIRFLKDKLKSKGTKSAKRHLRSLSHKERNISKDMCHRAAKTLLESTDASVIVMEDLAKIKQNTSKTKEGYKRKRHNSALSQVPFYMFREILTHKAQLSGRKVETVSPTWTSQTDSRNGKRNGNRKGCRYYCEDGIVFDSDWNAAVNIAIRGKHPFPNVLPIDGRLIFLNGRALSTVPTGRPVKGSCSSPLL